MRLGMVGKGASRIGQTPEGIPRISLLARQKGQSLVHFEQPPFPAAGASLRVTFPHPGSLGAFFTLPQAHATLSSAQ